MKIEEETNFSLDMNKVKPNFTPSYNILEKKDFNKTMDSVDYAIQYEENKGDIYAISPRKVRSKDRE